MTINQLLANYNANKINFDSDYAYFNEYYSLDALAKLNDTELAERLFGGRNNNVKGACPGLFSWLEWGYNKQYPATIQKPFGIAKYGFQVGIQRQSNNQYAQYNLKRRGKVKAGLRQEWAESYAKKIRDVLQEMCQCVKMVRLDTINGYELLFGMIEGCLAGKGNDLYWNNETGEPMAFLLKYLHCTYPDKFSCWHTNAKLNEVCATLGFKPAYKESFMINAELALYAKKIGIDNANFERLI